MTGLQQRAQPGPSKDTCNQAHADQPVHLGRLLIRCQHLVQGVPTVCTCQDPATEEGSCGSHPGTSPLVLTCARGPGGPLASCCGGPHSPADSGGQDYEVGIGDSPAVHNSTGGHRLLRGQLGGTFWGASHHHNRPGDPVHWSHVAVYVQSPGGQAREDYCLPTPVQRYGRVLPPAAEGGATCQV